MPQPTSQVEEMWEYHNFYNGVEISLSLLCGSNAAESVDILIKVVPKELDVLLSFILLKSEY